MTVRWDRLQRRWVAAATQAIPGLLRFARLPGLSPCAVSSTDASLGLTNSQPKNIIVARAPVAELEYAAG